MFYCDPCADKHGWPETFSKSGGNCEMCGKRAVCNDCPSSALPESKTKKEKKESA